MSNCSAFRRCKVPFAIKGMSFDPETETRTKAFALVYAKFNHPVFKPLLQRSMLSAVATVVEQDTRAIETSYPRQPAKIRLPNEEIMFHAQKLYREW